MPGWSGGRAAGFRTVSLESDRRIGTSESSRAPDPCRSRAGGGNRRCPRRPRRHGDQASLCAASPVGRTHPTSAPMRSCGRARASTGLGRYGRPNRPGVRPPPARERLTSPTPRTAPRDHVPRRYVRAFRDIRRLIGRRENRRYRTRMTQSGAAHHTRRGRVLPVHLLHQRAC